MKLYYAVHCGNDVEYYTNSHKKEKWAEALLYGETLKGYEVSNFGGITKNGKNVDRNLDIEGTIAEGEIFVNIEGKGNILLYQIIASTFLDPPKGGYGQEGSRKHIHHRDNNSYNFNPDNMIFLEKDTHKNQPHLNRHNINNWDKLIDDICNM